MPSHKGEIGKINYSVGFVVDQQSAAELKQVINQLSTVGVSSTDQRMSVELREGIQAAQKLKDILNSSWNGKIGQLNLDKVNTQIKQAYGNVDNLRKKMVAAGPDGVAAFNKVASSILNTNNQIKQSSKLLDKMALTFANTVRFSIASSIVQNLAGSVQKAWDYSVKLDTSLNDIRIVTGKSADEMERFAETANSAAKSLGASTKDYTDASLIYYQQGLDDEEAQRRAEITLKTANVTGQSGREASEQLTAIWNGYKVTAEEAELYIDKVAKVAATSAADLEELATGMSKVASAANSAGVDIDQLNATLATVVSVTREAPETIGSAFKTIYARLGDLKLGGTDEEGVSLGKVSGQLHELGIEILDQQGNMREMGDIVEDIAAKWQTWTQAQRQAAAVAMAGKMQYSRLIALFDNWDRYTKYLNDSATAAGTLDEQQTIYMDRVEAHLQTLRTEAEKTYDILFDTESVNEMIDATTGLLKILNSGLSGLGGGLQTLIGLGTNLANIFSKQLGASINNVLQNIQIKRNNITAQDLKSSIATQYRVEGENVSPDSAKVEAEANAAQKILSIKQALTQEEYEQLTVIQKRLGASAEILQSLQDYKRIALELFGDEDASLRTFIEREASLENQIRLQKELNNDKAREIKSQARNYNDGDKRGNISNNRRLKQNLKDLADANTTTVVDKKNIQSALNKMVDHEKITQEEIASVLKAQKDTINEMEAEYRQVQQGLGQKQQADDAQTSQQNDEALLAEVEKQKQRQIAIQETIAGMTSLASAITLVQGAVQTLFNEDLSWGEKITSIMTSTLFMLPSLISLYKTLDTLNTMRVAKKQQEVAIETMISTIRQKNIAELTQEQIIEQAGAILKEKNIMLSQSEIATRLASAGVITADAAATNVDTTAKGANTAATGALTGAQWALNASMLANPVTWVVIGILALVAGVAALTSHYANVNKEIRENNDAMIDNANATQAEIDANNELYQSYTKLYDAYQDGTATKEDLAKETDNLVELLGKERVEVAKLTGDYETLNKEILEAQKTAAEKGLESAQTELTHAEDNVRRNAKDGLGYQDGDRYKINWGNISGASNADESKIGSAIVDVVDPSMLREYQQLADGSVWMQGFDVAFEAKDIANLYDKLQEVVSLTNDAESAYFMTGEEKQKSEAYGAITEWLSRMKDDVKAYKQAIADIAKYSGQLEALNIDFTKTESVSDIREKRQALVDYLKTLEEYKGKSDDDIEKVADQYIGAQSDKADKLLKQMYVIDDLVEKFGADSQDKITKQIEQLSDEELTVLFTLEVDKIKSDDNIEKYIKYAQASAKHTKAVQLYTDAEDIYNATRDNKDFTEDQIEAVQRLESEYKFLGEILDKQSHEYYDALIRIREQEEKNAREAKKDLQEQSIDEALEMKVDADTTDFDDKLAEIAKRDYNVLVEIETDIQSDFDSLITVMDEMETMASKIGDNFVVAAEDIEELGNAFPGILDNMKLLADGTAQLSQTSVENAMATAQEEVRLSTETTVEKLKNQQAELEAKQAAAQTIATIAHQITQGEKTQADAQGAINEALNILKEENTETTTDYEKDSQKDVADTAALNASSMSNSFAQAYQKMSEDSAKWAETAKQNFLVATTGKGNPSTASFNTGWSATSNSGTVATADKGELTSEVKADSDVNWEDVEGYYQQLADAYGNAANNIQGKIGEILARNNQLNTSTKNISKGLGSDGKKDGGSKNDPDKMDYLDDEPDRYHEVDTQLEKIGNQLKKIQSQTDKLFGKDLIDNLNQQLGKLNEQIDVTSEKIGIAKDEAAELRNELSGQGVTFNADGTISNYMEIYTAKLNYVNGLIAQYNSMSKEEQESYKEVVEQAKKDFEEFTTSLDNYDTLISSTIPTLEQEIQDAIDEKIQIQIEKFNMEIEIRLDMKEAEKDWLDFKKKVIDQIKEDDIFGNATANLAQFASYYEGEAGNIIAENTKHINDIMDQIDQINKTGTSTWYGDNKNKALEDLQTYYQEMMTMLEDMQDLADEIQQSYLDMMDEAKEKFDDQVATYEQINDIIEHDMKVIELIYGEESYSDLAKYYEQQHQNNLQNLDFQRQEVEFWKQQMDAAEEGTERWEKAKENWMDAVSNWNSTIEDSINTAKDQWVNAINEVFQELNNKVTGGLGLDYVTEEWNLINKNADQYLDTINSLYGIQKIQNKYLDGIDQTDSISAQKRLNELMEQEVAALREKDKLTQYDIDRAELKYQIALKQIALEEAQQNKSTMRLRRDSQGNYSYQFVEDQSETGKLQDELSDLYNQLYNFDLSHYKDNLNQILETWTEYQEKMAEVALINDPELRAQKELLLQEQYGELINGLVEQNETVRLNLHESGFTELADLYNIDVENFQAMTDEERDIMLEQMIPQWDSGVQHMADVFAGEGGFAPTCEDAMLKLDNVTDQYLQKLGQIESAGGTSFSTVRQGVDDNIQQTQQLLWDNQKLIDSYGTELQAIQNVIDQLQRLQGQYKATQTAAEAATEAAYRYWQAENREAANAAGKEVANGNNGGSVRRPVQGALEEVQVHGSSGSGSSGSGSGGDGVAKVGDVATYLGGTYYYDSYGTAPSGNRGPGKKVTITQVMNDGRPYPIHVQSSDSAYGWLKLSQLKGYDTGGYTGDWGDNSGRLALLHRKEMVLNSDDTKNFLNALDIMRTITSSIGSDVLSRLANTKAGTMNTEPAAAGIEQNVTINADFPDVRDAEEIKDAFNNLLNIATMRINRK